VTTKYISITILAIILFALPHVCAAETDNDTIPPDYTDGPHIFWQNDSTAIVFYDCDNELLQKSYKVTDSLTFAGLCHDSNTTYFISTAPPVPGPEYIPQANRVFAISDIHGDYDHFAEILIATGIVDDNLRWIWGDGHLVIDGDVFDRGPAVTECLWLIYRLEREARRVGGGVHFLLGNHELMVLRGDERYVNERYTNGIVRKSRIGYDDLFGPETELGRWLRTKNTAIIINRTLYVHGGLLPEHLDHGRTLSDLNRIVRDGLDVSSARLTFTDSVKNLYGGLGPLWYRGYTMALEDRYPLISEAQLDSVLTICDVDNIVVGHTQQEPGITTYQNGKIIAIDVVVEDLDGQRGLLWQDGTFYRVDNQGHKHPLVSE